jgi:hypothetical protein
VQQADGDETFFIMQLSGIAILRKVLFCPFETGIIDGGGFVGHP